MISLTHDTSAHKLNKVKIGDEITDEYQSQGKVVKINKSVINDLREYLFHLDSRQIIYILSKAM